MSICPKDNMGCCDDLCHGSGCMRMDGYPMLQHCPGCGGLIDTELPECSTCTCEEDDQDDDWFPEDDDD